MPRTWQVAWGCIVALLCITPIALAAETTDLDRRAVLARQRDHYLQSVESLQPLAEHRMRQILNLRVRSGQLALSTPLKPLGYFEGRRANIQGLSSPAAVTYVQFVANNPAARQFEFKLEEYPDADTFNQIHLQWQPGALGRVDDLSIERAEQTSNGFFKVFYHQGPTMARVLVFANDASTDHNVESFNCMERDFATLCKLHPIEVERYLRPTLHLLGQEVVFAPEVNTAWQVLAADWPVDERVSRQVRRILPELNDASSRVRNDATDQLTAMGLDGASTILRMDRSGLSPEQNVRLDNVIFQFRQISTIAARQLAEDPDFLLDCEYCEDQTIRTLALARLARVLGHPVSLDPNAPEADRVEAVEEARGRLHPSPATAPSFQNR